MFLFNGVFVLGTVLCFVVVRLCVNDSVPSVIFTERLGLFFVFFFLCVVLWVVCLGLVLVC
jgi:hypothetical protein